ncbi:MAG TPA: sugar transferase, partial [Acidimicrobiia bacterium]|nr:sugar transferase [Acidimicrobiia bacterium]
MQTTKQRSSTSRTAYFATKRVIDVAVAIVCLVVLSPVLIVIAIAIAIDSRGPVIFRQARVRGRRVRGGEQQDTGTFLIWKFRTMEHGADSALHQEYITAYIRDDRDRLEALRPGRSANESFRPAHDPRVTRVGRVLRRLSLDEIPQLWNVVRGDMSLVGPRPPLPYEVALYSERDRRRLTTPQGITGWA